jgi:signal peptidase I
MSPQSPSPYAPPHQSATPPAETPRNAPRPAIAMILSFFATGAGQIYAGRTRRGILWGLGPIAVIMTLAILERFAHSAFIVAVLAAGVLSIAACAVCVLDAGRLAAASREQRAPVWHVIVFWIALLVVTEVTAVSMRRFVVEAFKIPASSMSPTLLVGDHIYVDKSPSDIKRGDVIVFPFPEHPNQDFIKRVVALPGDRIEFRGGVPVLNGAPIPRCRAGSFSYDDEGTPTPHHEGDLFVEALDGHPYLALYDRDGGGVDYQGPWTVKPGEAFVVGDNRHNSHDSRTWFQGQGGGLSLATVRGKAFVVWLALERGGIDWERSGSAIDELRLPKSAEALAPEVARCAVELRPAAK